MSVFDDPAQVIHVAVGGSFAIRLAGNPTTGYTWQPAVDARHLELVTQDFEPGGEAPGSAGHEVCRFRALAPGRTEIQFEYRRPWQSEARDTQNYQVVIS